MTHNRDHIVIHSIASTVSFSEDSSPGRLKVWHCGLSLLIAGLLIGLAM